MQEQRDMFLCVPSAIGERMLPRWSRALRSYAHAFGGIGSGAWLSQGRMAPRLLDDTVALWQARLLSNKVWV